MSYDKKFVKLVGVNRDYSFDKYELRLRYNHGHYIEVVDKTIENWKGPIDTWRSGVIIMLEIPYLDIDAKKTLTIRNVLRYYLFNIYQKIWWKLWANGYNKICYWLKDKRIHDINYYFGYYTKRKYD